MDMDVWRIECPDGIGQSTTVTYNGVPLTNVRAASVRIDTDDVVTATFEVENVEVAIGALKLEAAR